MKHDTNGQILGNAAAVIPIEVENGTAGKPRRRREDHRLSEREVSESNPVAEPA